MLRTVTSLRSPLLTDAFLASHYAAEYAQFRDSAEEKALAERLKNWAERQFQNETAAENTFIDIFFKDTWNYWGAGARSTSEGFNLYPKFPITQAGERGGTGYADLALGWFDRAPIAPTPQAVCEFKDIRSGLDKPQRRKGNDRSPVQQCADYLKEASKRLFGNEPIQPTWAILSDMNEVRLYWRRTMPSQMQRFVIQHDTTERSMEVSLLDTTEEARFQRFVFAKLLHQTMLLSTNGPSKLEKLILEQGHHEHAIENEFYREYQRYRESIFRALVAHNPGFSETRGKLVRLAQRFLDRCIFILFCEDMGAALHFPPHVLRDMLVRESLDPHYDPRDVSVWHKVKRLFAAMRDGTPFGDARINRFNGGLFAEEPELEQLVIPNDVFCVRGQGGSETSIIDAKETLLFFSAHYNFGVRGGDFERSIGLHTLGRIFEQSIVDLEFMEAKADNRPSLTELSKRKRDGVYYTPEWVTYFIVDETLGAHLLDLRRKYNIAAGSTFTEDELADYQFLQSGKRRRAADKRIPKKLPAAVVDYLARLDAYAHELDDVKVLDPACGSGAFLIQALDRLVNERRWVTEERERIAGSGTLFDIEKITRAVLTKNLYGVDINTESVEITRLALWLHSALPDRPLCSLDENIRCGNSLVGPDFYEQPGQRLLFDAHAQERINVFDWVQAFANIFSRPNGKAGFDCIVGNPPYVKLQNFKRVDTAVSDYLVQARDNQGAALYESTQTQNFDLYLPFIEKGMNLLNEQGRMGYIAPSVWLVNEYGEGLRRLVHRTQKLERWIDFKDFQVFNEAITYTALQFFRGKPSPAVVCTFAPNGYVAGTEWAKADTFIDYSSLDPNTAWHMLRTEERMLIERLRKTCDRLDKYPIIVGVQTSADAVYHLERLGPGKYREHPKGKAVRDVDIEDAIMRPLVSGEAAKRYREPSTTTYILFPYDDTNEARLYTPAEMANRFPRAWAYLESHQSELRARESGKFDDDEWYRFGRHQNIGKQSAMKLGVAQTVPNMRVFFDRNGQFCFNNVRVNAIVPPDESTGWFLLGVLNSFVVDFVFRRMAKPKEGGYFEANKQFIGPLPIPRDNAAQRKHVAEAAKLLQDLHTRRQRCLNDLDRRLTSSQTRDDIRPASWLWADVHDIDHWKNHAPSSLNAKERLAWAKEKLAESLLDKFKTIDIHLRSGARIEVQEDAEELGITIDGTNVISGIFTDIAEAPFIAAQWRHKLRNTTISPSFKAKQLANLLLDLRSCAQVALQTQIIRIDAEVRTLDTDIAKAESEMNDLVHALYELTAEERALVERDQS